jgi:hypothetical protein
VVEQRRAEPFGALALTSQLIQVRYAEVVVHLLRHIVRRPGRSCQSRDPLEYKRRRYR